jgi:hypothetical protein
MTRSFLQSSSEARLEVVTEPVDGGEGWNESAALNRTIGKCVELAALSKGQECAMVVFVDRKQQQVLLKIPNKLDWRLHFGCDVPPSNKEDGKTLSKTATETAQQAAEETFGIGLDLRPAGLMLFTFVDDDHPPMRVRIFETNPPDDCALTKFL